MEKKKKALPLSDEEEEFHSKKIRINSDDEDDDDLSKKQNKNIAFVKKDPRKKGKYDLVLSDDQTNGKLIPPYNIYIGKGIAIEVKEYRKSYYVCFSKSVDNDVKNRFNVPLEQVKMLKKAVDTLANYVKDY